MNRDRVADRLEDDLQPQTEVIKDRQSKKLRKNRIENRGKKRVLQSRETKAKQQQPSADLDVSENAGPKKFIPVPDPETAQGILVIHNKKFCLKKKLFKILLFLTFHFFLCFKLWNMMSIFIISHLLQHKK